MHHETSLFRILFFLFYWRVLYWFGGFSHGLCDRGELLLISVFLRAVKTHQQWELCFVHRREQCLVKMIPAAIGHKLGLFEQTIYWTERGWVWLESDTANYHHLFKSTCGSTHFFHSRIHSLVGSLLEYSF